MNKTKRTSVSTRVMITYNFCNFEASSTIENPEGVTEEENNQEIMINLSSAKKAVDVYKLNPDLNPKKELANVEKQLEAIKKHLDQKESGSSLKRQE